MNTAKVYHDIDGNDHTIHQMVRNEPGWAASRVQQAEEYEAGLLAWFEQQDSRDKKRVDAPGHCHPTRGVWDWDNGDKSCKPCAECALWTIAKRIAEYHERHNASLQVRGARAAGDTSPASDC